jgi:hypothetical protein
VRAALSAPWLETVLNPPGTRELTGAQKPPCAASRETK